MLYRSFSIVNFVFLLFIFVTLFLNNCFLFTFTLNIRSNTHGSTSSDSVFSRLGNTVNREDSPTSVLIKKTTDPSAAMQRFIRWNLNDNSLGSPFRPSPSVAETIMNSPEDSLNFKVVKQVSGLTKSLDQSVKLRTPLKRHVSIHYLCLTSVQKFISLSQ